jgi:hypothetical protein
MWLFQALKITSMRQRVQLLDADDAGQAISSVLRSKWSVLPQRIVELLTLLADDVTESPATWAAKVIEALCERLPKVAALHDPHAIPESAYTYFYRIVEAEDQINPAVLAQLIGSVERLAGAQGTGSLIPILRLYLSPFDPLRLLVPALKVYTQQSSAKSPAASSLAPLWQHCSQRLL